MSTLRSDTGMPSTGPGGDVTVIQSRPLKAALSCLLAQPRVRRRLSALDGRVAFPLRIYARVKVANINVLNTDKAPCA